MLSKQRRVLIPTLLLPVVQDLQPQLIATVGEVEGMMERIAKEKQEVVEPKASAVKVDEAAAQQQVGEA